MLRRALLVAVGARQVLLLVAKPEKQRGGVDLQVVASTGKADFTGLATLPIVFRKRYLKVFFNTVFFSDSHCLAVRNPRVFLSKFLTVHVGKPFVLRAALDVAGAPLLSPSLDDTVTLSQGLSCKLLCNT